MGVSGRMMDEDGKECNMYDMQKKKEKKEKSKLNLLD